MSEIIENITIKLTDNSEKITIKTNDKPRGATGLQGEPGAAIDTFESVSKNLDDDDASLTFSGGQLVTVTYSSGVIKTLSYTLGKLTSVTLSGSTPSGINLIKTIAYSGDEISSITYS